MASQITTGAYVIRKKGTSTAIHITSSPFSEWSWIEGLEQDEISHRDRQIWWVEPLPDQQPSEEGLVYSITNTSSGNVLGLEHGNRKRYTYLTASPENGAPWQRWRLLESENSDRKYYTIASAHNNQVISGNRGDWLFSQAGSTNQHWEFAIPVVALPPGWLQIKNIGIGGLLKHTYLSSPPLLALPLPVSWPPENRESWGSLWAFAPIKSYFPNILGSGLNGLWCIKNRLTNRFLRSSPTGITAQELNITDVLEYAWRLELDSDRNWNITNTITSFLLEGSNISRSGGAEVLCISKGRSLSHGWNFISPVIEVAEGVQIKRDISID